MKKFFALGNQYLKESDWKDLALIKFCLCAMGILIGLLIPSSGKRIVLATALVVFLTTYVLLMAKVYRIWKKMK